MNKHTIRGPFARSIAACLSVALFALLCTNGCGARQQNTPLPALEGRYDLPQDTDALNAAEDEAAQTGAQAFIQAFIHILHGDVDAAYDSLMSPHAEWNAPTLRIGRLALMIEHYGQLMDSDPLREWVQRPDMTVQSPQERVLLTALRRVVAVETLNRTDADHVPSALPFGGSKDWTVVGSIGSKWTDAIDTRGPAASVDSLGEMPLSARQRRHTYPTVFGLLEHNPQPGGVGLYESFLRIDEPTRVAITRFGATDYFSVWINDARIFGRNADDVNHRVWHMPVFDLQPGTYRVLMVLHSANTTVQPPQIIPLRGHIAAFSAEAGPAQGGAIRRVNTIAQNLTAALPNDETTLGPVAWLVHATVALLGDDALGYALSENAPDVKHPIIAYVRSSLLQTLRDDPVAHAKALRGLRDIDARWGSFDAIRTRIAQIEFQAADDETAPRQLAPLANDAEHSPHLRIAYAAMIHQLGFDAIAYSTLRDLAHQYPHWCDAWTQYLRLALGYRGVLRADDFAGAPMFCTGVRNLHNVVIHRWRGDDKAYNKALKRAIARGGNDPTQAISVFWNLLKLDDPSAAAAYIETLKSMGLTKSELTEARAALAFRTQGLQGAIDVLTDANARRPDKGTNQIERARLSAEPLFKDSRVKGTEVLRKYRASEFAKNARADVVYVLDYGDWRFFENGGSISIVHQMFALNSRSAVENMGEIVVPSRATVLKLRVIKPDGTTRAPQKIAGKSSLSFPDLDVGDVIEQETIRFAPAPEDGQLHYQSPRFYFQTANRPQYVSELRVEYPTAWKEHAILETHHFKGQHIQKKHDGRRIDVLMVDHQSPYPSERWTPHAEEFAPWAQFFAFPSARDQFQQYDDYILPEVAPSPEIDALAAKIVKDVDGARAQIHALFRYVNDKVQGSTAFFGTSARQTARMGQGDRFSLLYALLTARGFSPQLCLVDDFDSAQYPSKVFSTARYDGTAIYVEADDAPLWLVPDREYAPFDRLPSYLQGRDAVVVVGNRQGETLHTPENLDDDAYNRARLEVWLDADGNARFRYDVAFGPFASTNTREALRHVRNQSDRVRYMERQLSSSFGSATLDSLEIEHEKSPDKPLLFHMKGTLNGLGDVQGNVLSIERRFDTSKALMNYTATSSRDLPLLVPTPTHIKSEFIVHPPKGWTRVHAPNAEHFVYRDDVFKRVRKASSDHSAHWVRELHVHRARIQSEDYPDFARFGQQVRNAERVRLKWAQNTPKK